MSFTITDYANKEYIGYSASMMPFVEFRMFKKKIKGLNFNVSLGVSYFTKSYAGTIFSLNFNPNALIGSQNNWLFIGGTFTTIQDVGPSSSTNISNITFAYYQSFVTFNGWSQVTYASPQIGFGSGTVKAITYIGTDFYIGGILTSVGPDALNINNIVKYEYNAGWKPLFNSAANNIGLNGTVNALASNGTYLYIGGEFTATSGATPTLNYIAVYNPSNEQWSQIIYTISGDIGLNLNGFVNSLYYSSTDSNVYIGGVFTSSGTTNALQLSRVAKINSATFPIPTEPKSENFIWLPAMTRFLLAFI